MLVFIRRRFARLRSFLRPVAIVVAFTGFALVSGLDCQAGEIPSAQAIANDASDCGVNMSCGPRSAQPATPAGPAQCGPATGGETCTANEGPASQSGNSANVGAGNPINVINGNKYQREVDLPPLPGVLGLEIVRHYNSAYSAATALPGIFGRGWKLSYDTELYAIGNTIQILQADGRRVIFSRDPANRAMCSTPDPVHGKLRISGAQSGRSERYTWTWPDGRTLDFDTNGKLVQIAVPSGEFVSLLRDPNGFLLQVTDPQGRQLRLHYPDRQSRASAPVFRGVASIDSPVGKFGYRYGTDMPPGVVAGKASGHANLVGVDVPGSHPSRVYHYEDGRRPNFLSGIRLVGVENGTRVTQRIGTYLYDLNGRAVLTVSGMPARLQTDETGKPRQPARLVEGTGVGQVTLDFTTPGLTVLHNSLGQAVTYRHAVVGGEYRLLEVRGPGCNRCGEMNVRYRHDHLGRLVEVVKLDLRGQPVSAIRTERDRLGRVVQSSMIRYAGGKVLPPQLQTRYEYRGEDAQPALIAQPGVVSMREATVRIRYNERGQTVAVTESGWSPPIQPQTIPIAIERTTTYRYSMIGGRSLLREIDGPLANGPANSPADSDITVIDYDPRGNYPIGVTMPGNFTRRMREFTAAGFPVLVESADGVNPPQRTRIERDVFGQVTKSIAIQNARSAEDGGDNWLTHVARQFGIIAAAEPDQRITCIAYDPFARQKRLTRPDGTFSETEYDQSGRPVRTRDQDGNTVTRSLDEEGHLLTTRMQSNVSGAHLDATTHYRYDEQNLLARTTDPSGAVTHTAYDPQTGLVASITDVLQRQARYQYDAAGRLANLRQNAQSVQSASTRFDYVADKPEVAAITAANGAVTRMVRDDFGRTRVVDSADSGRKISDYDVADRVVTSTDANGNRTRYTYDISDRLTGRVTTGNAFDGSAAVESVVYRYRGRLLTAVANGSQSTGYAHDADGRVVERVDMIRPVVDSAEKAREPMVFTTRYRYDAAGRMVAEVFPGNDILRLRYGANDYPTDTELVSVDGKSVWPLAKSILRHPFFGLLGFTYGNRLLTTFLHDDATGRSNRLAVIQNGTSDDSVSKTSSLPTWLPSAYAGNLKGELSARKFPLSPIYMQEIGYDPAGRITSILRQDLRSDSHATERFEYDVFDRLEKAVTTSENVVWSYDAAGNRLTAMSGTPSTSRTKPVQLLQYWPGSNRLQTVTTDGKVRFYIYDGSGNPVRIGNRRLVYSVNTRLSEIWEGSRLISRYSHNARGERVAKTVYGADGVAHNTYYLYEENHLHAEVDGKGSITARYFYLAHVPIAKFEYGLNERSPPTARDAKKFAFSISLFDWFMKEKTSNRGRLYPIHTDHLGTPRLMTDANQNIVWQASYATFGSGLVKTNSIAMNLRYPGQYFDVETGLHYNYFRDYDPSTGRYVESDPIGLEGGINTYGYVGGNPISFVDPFGLNPGTAIGGGIGSFIFPGVGTAVGAAIGTAVGFGVGAMIANKLNDGDGKTCPAPSNWYSQGKTPSTGEPGSTYINPSGQERKYGSDGKPEYDIDWHTDHGAGTPHGHNWDQGSNGQPVRGPGVPLSPWPQGRGRGQ